jgi:hypothetical protein
MTSFVRNRLLDEVYLPLIGDNLARQIGAAGDAKRTDQSGLLLLISPPGYGKTTLMKYVADRLGLIFVKVNGPALGHSVTSLDPAGSQRDRPAGGREGEGHYKVRKNFTVEPRLPGMSAKIAQSSARPDDQRGSPGPHESNTMSPASNACTSVQPSTGSSASQNIADFTSKPNAACKMSRSHASAWCPNAIA